MPTHPRLQLLTLQTRLQRHLLHWPLPQLRHRVLPLLLFQRRLRLLSPQPGDTRPGWGLGPLLLCIRDHVGGPRLPSRTRTSGSGESSRSRPKPSPPPTDQSSSPQLSPHTRITRPMFSCDPIPGNVNLRARDFHGESYYNIPALTADHRFRDSMRLIQRYSLLPFMNPR